MAKKYPIRLSETIFDILELKETGATNEQCGKIIAARYGRSTPFAESSIRYVLGLAEQTEQEEGEESDNVESEEAEAEAEAETPATSKKKWRGKRK